MEPEDSLLPSQEPSTGPYPEPDRSNPTIPHPTHNNKKNSCNMWNQSIEKLIEEVEKRPALYLKSLKEYSDTKS
jgi:hypothetical protein